jgi:inner membrane protein
MTWFLIFASTVFGLYFWMQYRSRQRELQRPTAEHRSGMRYIGEALTLQAPIQNGAGRVTATGMSVVPTCQLAREFG